MKNNTKLEQPNPLLQAETSINIEGTPEDINFTDTKEQAPNIEQTRETQSTQETEQYEQSPDHLDADTIVTPAHHPAPVIIPSVRDPLTSQIEKIMEAGLVDAFKEMNEIQKQEFKIKGEQVALEIKQLLGKSKVKIKKIFELLVSWLQIIPGISRFFIQQEAKIKADKLLALKLHPNLNPQ